MAARRGGLLILDKHTKPPIELALSGAVQIVVEYCQRGCANPVAEREKSKEKAPKKREKLPPKGTPERALLAAGLWSHMTREEIEEIKREIFTSRRSKP